MTVAGVIVAAGAATRLGRPKQVELVGDRPLLQWVVDAAEASRLDRLAVVTGHHHEVVRRSVRLTRAVWAHNPQADRGTMSSLRTGVRVLGAADAVVKLVSDQPEVGTAVIDALIDARDPGRFDVLVTGYRDGEGHPVLVEWAALGSVIEQDGDRLLWTLAHRIPGRVLRVPFDGLRPVDVNTTADLSLAAARLGAAGP